ncbi:MAG: hypothetical protein ABFE02_14485 [Sulfuricella sp.]
MTETIESILAGRELIPREDLSRCFCVVKGHGVGPNTLIHCRRPHASAMPPRVTYVTPLCPTTSLMSPWFQGLTIIFNTYDLVRPVHYLWCRG